MISSNEFIPANIDINVYHLSVATLFGDNRTIFPNLLIEEGTFVSAYILAALYHIPVPAMYIETHSYESIHVTYNKDMAFTFEAFIQNKNPIDCEFDNHFDKLYYKDLPRMYQRRILETLVTVYNHSSVNGDVFTNRKVEELIKLMNAVRD